MNKNYWLLLKYKIIRDKIDKINNKYTIKFTHINLLKKNNANDKKERNFIKFKSSSLYFLYLTEKGIANLGTILPLQFKYIKAIYLPWFSNLFIPSNHIFILLTSQKYKTL